MLNCLPPQHWRAFPAGKERTFPNCANSGQLPLKYAAPLVSRSKYTLTLPPGLAISGTATVLMRLLATLLKEPAAADAGMSVGAAEATLLPAFSTVVKRSMASHRPSKG